MSLIAETTVITALTKGLQAALLKGAGRRLRKFLEEPERSRALRRCCEAGVVAMVGTCQAEDEDERHLLDDVFRNFFTGETTRDDVGTALAQLLRGQPLDRAEIDDLFADAGYEAGKLPSVDFGRALDFFEGAFLTAALRESALQGELGLGIQLQQLEAAQRQLEALQGIRTEIEQLVTFLGQARLGTVELAARQVKALGPDGSPLLLQLAAAPEPPSELESNMTAYLEDLIDHCDHISVIGIGSSHAQTAIRHPIERLYTPLSSRGMDLDARQGKANLAKLLQDPPATLDRPPLESRHKRLLLEGQPGAGKTTFLHLVATLLARDVLGKPCPEGGTWRERHLGFEPETPARIPVFLRISELVASFDEDGAPRLRRDNRLWLCDLLARSCEHNGCPVPSDHWEQLLEDGDAILLLDGLDEVAGEPLRRRVFSIFRDAAKRWKCPMVVTSRPIATEDLREAGFHLAQIDPFGRAEIETFVGRWVQALHTVTEGQRSSEAERYREILLAAITDRARVRRLASNPVMLTCLCVVHWNEGRLPEGRSRVYRAVLRWLIAARSALRDEQGFSDLFAWRAFARLALAMMEGENGKVAVLDFETAALAIEPLLAREEPGLSKEERRHRAREWLGFECLGSNVVEELPGRRIRFWHLTFQEFLAALQLAWRGDGEDPKEDWWPALREHLDDAQWRETVELVAGCLLDEGGVGRVDRLLERVLALRGEAPDLETDARVTGILGRLLLPLSALDYKPSAELQSTYEAGLQRTLAIFTKEGAAQVPWKLRVAAAEALGRGGDPRLAAGAEVFIEVPGLDGWRLGKYPVTVEEYQRFVEGRGYEEPRYWGEDGWRLREKKGWEMPGSWEDQLQHPSRPVTGVSWYEAEAYCAWLGSHRGVEMRLPHEPEWEAAARPDRREYPWGEAAPGPDLANYARIVGSPTPVGCYPAGDGRYGHSDLAGNVWEWSADRMEGKGEGVRVLRGGSWFSSAEYLRAAIRGGHLVSSRLDDIGFRVVAAPASLAS